jgi:predicted ATP-grasp superfamily ATP-dependent carboligase
VIELENVPELVRPVMIAAFEGWNDAGDAASGVIKYLADTWKAEELAAIDPDDYYDFQVNRPLTAIGENGTREITWPTTRVLLAHPPAAERDVVLLHGIEPNMRWRAFTAELLGWCRDLKVEMVVTLGALLADSPHTRPIPVSGTSSDPDLAEELHLERSRYEGPTGITGIMQDACRKAGLPAVSIWAAVPHYVSQPPCPKATLALLRKVEDVLDLSIPLGDLPEYARAWERGVDELAAEDTEVAEYVRSLEEAKDTAELPEASGEAIAQEFERYLRRRDPGSQG